MRLWGRSCAALSGSAYLLGKPSCAFGEECVDAFAAVGAIGTCRDEPALDLHLLFEAVTECGQQQPLHSRSGVLCPSSHFGSQSIGSCDEIVVGYDLGDQTPLRGLAG